MKIAVASTGSHVARHFALCESFHIYMVYGGKIMKETDIPNPGLRPARLPEFLGKQKVNAVICGGMGGRTEALFREKGIDAQVGVIGDTRTAALEYLKKLRNSGALEANKNTVCIQDGPIKKIAAIDMDRL